MFFQQHAMRAFLALTSTLVTGAGTQTFAQSLPNPYRMVESWAHFTDGREMGAVGDVTMDPDGEHVWAVIRCDAPGELFGWECLDSDLDPVVKFNLEGAAVQSFGGGMFIWPHGIFADDDGNIWVTDAISAARTPEGGTRGHQVVKFSPSGEVLMTLGTPGKPGSDNYSFNAPSDVAIGNNGDIFVTDGHGNDTNNRVMKYSSDGTFIKSWGRTGYGPGEFRELHAIAIGPEGRLYIADRWNNRVQIFDQEGEFIAMWNQFGRPSGISFDGRGRIYVADSESDNEQNPGFEMGIRIGDAETGWVEEFVLFPWGDPRIVGGNGAEFVAVDREGNLYGGEPRPRQLRKYVRVRP